MTIQSSHMVHMASLLCLMAPIWYIERTGIQHGATWRPHGSDVSPYGEHAPIWLTLGSRCTVHTSHTALIQCMQLPYGACGSYVAYAAPIWCTQLPYSTHGSHIEHTTPMWSGTCSHHMVPCASHMVPCSSKMARTAPTQHTQLPYDPHMSHSGPR
jgi:hypothetical protein